jgi:pyridoxal phosphate enzyme (YggS family)
MSFNNDIELNLNHIKGILPDHVVLVAVSKTHPITTILEAYKTGHRIFGENKVQEMVAKYDALPKDIEWHMIGHLQSNKVKYIAPFVSLIHGVDNFKLLLEIEKQAQKNNRIINCLLQVHIAQESTKFGFDQEGLAEALSSASRNKLKHVCIKGLMGMATFTTNEQQITNEFKELKHLYDHYAAQLPDFSILSMGMSGDYAVALACGSNMIRIGSSIFGSR